MEQAPLSTVDPLAMWATAVLVIFVLCAYGLYTAIIKPLAIFAWLKWKNRKQF